MSLLQCVCPIHKSTLPQFRIAIAISGQNPLIFPLIFFAKCYSFSPDFSFLSTDVGSVRALTLFFAFHTFSSIKCGTAHQNDCTERNAIKKGKTWQLSHSTGCMTENRESHLSKIKQWLIKNFPDFSKYLSFFLLIPD